MAKKNIKYVTCCCNACYFLIVPVWAAEFSDGTDTAVETEAPAAETFSDDAAPVVEDTTDTTAAKATTNGTGFDITATVFYRCYKWWHCMGQ